MTVVGTVCGVCDLLLFYKVVEPSVQRGPSPRLRDILAEPFRNREFRRYISFMCFWNFAAMTGAPFIVLYLLTEVGMDLFHVMLLTTLSWVGGAMFSRTLGRWADSHGSQPVLVMCVALKSTIMLSLLFVPHSPTIAFWILAPCFMLDAVLNAGILIANNGFMIKNSPTENRTMYIAATQAVAGMVGGVTSILSGWLLKSMDLASSGTSQDGHWAISNFNVSREYQALLTGGLGADAVCARTSRTTHMGRCFRACQRHARPFGYSIEFVRYRIGRTRNRSRRVRIASLVFGPGDSQAETRSMAGQAIKNPRESQRSRIVSTKCVFGRFELGRSWMFLRAYSQPRCSESSNKAPIKSNGRADFQDYQEVCRKSAHFSETNTRATSHCLLETRRGLLNPLRKRPIHVSETAQ